MRAATKRRARRHTHAVAKAAIPGRAHATRRKRYLRALRKRLG